MSLLLSQHRSNAKARKNVPFPETDYGEKFCVSREQSIGLAQPNATPKRLHWPSAPSERAGGRGSSPASPSDCGTARALRGLSTQRDYERLQRTDAITLDAIPGRRPLGRCCRPIFQPRRHLRIIWKNISSDFVSGIGRFRVRDIGRYFPAKNFRRTFRRGTFDRTGNTWPYGFEEGHRIRRDRGPYDDDRFVSVKFSALRQTRWYEYAIRFVLGGKRNPYRTA